MALTETFATTKIVLIFAAGLVAATISFCLVSDGLALTPDGWAYWEGFVSLLDGNGYRYFGGQRIVVFPPLFPIVLACLQAVFGVSGRTLAIGITLLAGATAAIWMYLLEMTKPPRTVAVFGAFYIGAFVGSYYRALLSETLYLGLFGLCVILLVSIATRDIGSVVDLRFLALLAVETAALLTRNISLAAIPSIAFLLFFGRPMVDLRSRIRQALLSVALPIAGWEAVRLALHQSGSHPLGAPHWTINEYLKQFLEDCAYRMGPLRFYLGTILLVSVIASIAFGLASGGISAIRMNRQTMRFTVLLLIKVAAVFLIFNLTRIDDPLENRYIWFVFLCLAVLVASTGAEFGKWSRRFSMAILCVMSATQLYRAAVNVRLKGLPNVTWENTIRSDWYLRPTSEYKQDGLVSPPDFSWLQRYSDRLQ